MHIYLNLREKGATSGYINPTDSPNQEYEGQIGCVLTFTGAELQGQMKHVPVGDENVFINNQLQSHSNNSESVLHFLSKLDENGMIWDDIQNDAAAESTPEELSLRMRKEKPVNSNTVGHCSI